MNISDKLTKINNIKGEIRTKIIEKGVDIPEDTLFEEYPSKIEEIQAGGGGEFILDISEHPEIKFAFSNFSEVPKYVVGWNKLTDGSFMFYENDYLTSFNKDLSSLTKSQSMFYWCSDLTSFDIDLPKLESGVGMFEMCGGLTSWNIPLPELTSGSKMFNNCSGLTSFNSDLPKITNGFSMFSGCSKLTSFEGDTPNLREGWNMFSYCTKLTTFSANLSSLNDSDTMFYDCTSLANVTLKGTVNIRIDWSDCPLTVESMVNIMNAMVDLTGQSSKTMYFGSSNLAKLNDEQKAIATNKNWVLN